MAKADSGLREIVYGTFKKTDMNKELIMFANGQEVRTDKDGLVCLTDLWKAAGSNPQNTPAKWQDTEASKAFIKATGQILNIAKTDIIKSKRGKGGGTYAHKQIALEYAQYADPKLAIAVNQVFFERIEQEKNPELAIDQAVKSWERKGKDGEWIAKRIEGITNRKVFTKALAAHDVKGVGFRDCTNAIYHHLYGGGANKVRERKNLPAKANTREHMTRLELAAVSFAEELAADNIKQKGLTGNKECEYECLSCSSLTAKTINASRKQAA